MNPDLVRVIAMREITTRLRDRAFLLSTGFLLAVVAASVAVPLFLNRDDGPPGYTLVTVGAPAAAVGEIARSTGQEAAAVQARRDEAEATGDISTPLPALGVGESGAPAAEIALRQAPDAGAAEQLVRDGEADAALLRDERSFVVIGGDGVESDLSRLITLATSSQEVADRLAQVGLDAAAARDLLTSDPPTQRLLDPPPADAGPAIVLGVGFAGLFSFTSFMFGFAISQSVVEEKQSRVVEILVAAVPVRTLLFGKVLGNTALALGQIALLLAVALAAVGAAGQPELVSVLLDAGVWFLLFFVLGFAMLACLWAVAGSVASRSEDLQSTTLPLQVVTMVPFFAAVWVTEPGRWMTALSYLPFSAPLVMPRRLLIGDAAWYEALGAAGLVLLTGVLLLGVATRLYEGSLLRTSGRTTLRTAWAGSRRV